MTLVTMPKEEEVVGFDIGGDYEIKKEPLEFFYESPRGWYIYRQLAGHGGYTYWIDDVGGGRVLFDEGIDDWDELDQLRLRIS